MRVQLARLGEQGLGVTEAAAIDLCSRLEHDLVCDDGQTGLRGGIARVVVQSELIVIAGVVVGGFSERALFEPLVCQHEDLVDTACAAGFE